MSADQHRDFNPDLRSRLKSHLPILQWLPAYRIEWLRGDIIAALTVWALYVLTGMAYATLAGVPAEAGLYLAPLVLLAYAVFGTSRHLIVGPSASVAAMTALAVAPLAGEDMTRYTALVTLLAMLTGVLCIAAGLFRMGFFADFLSRPVLDGFIIGLAITIVAEQLIRLLGYSVVRANFFQDLLNILLNLDQTHTPTLAVGVGSLMLLFYLDKSHPQAPSALIVMTLSIIVVGFFELDSYGVAVVGEIPSNGFPIGIPLGIDIADLRNLLPSAIALSLVGFAESVAIAGTYAAKHGYKIDVNQELIALGASNLGSSVSQGFTVDASLSRTTAADQAGIRTQMSSLINAALLLFTVIALTPLFHNLAEATLGAIVVHTVWRLIDLSKLRQLYDIKRADFWSGVAAMLGVLVIGIFPGLAFAILLSLAQLLNEARNPPIHILGKVPGREVFRGIEEHQKCELYPGLIILRFDANLFFANASAFHRKVLSATVSDPSVRIVLIDAESISDVDVTALDMLAKLKVELASKGIDLHFSRVKTNIRTAMRRSGVEETIGLDHFHMSVRDGVDTYLTKRQHELVSSQVEEETSNRK
jgi:SulP family sulfate permease